jgi:hypothetical protein
MTTPILIGVHGAKRAGKNSAATFIEEWAAEFDPAAVVRQRGFADKVKWAFARQFYPTISMENAIVWCDSWKDTPAVFTSSANVELPDSGWPVTDPIDEVGFRDALAQFATDGGRDIYGEDFWLDQLIALPTRIGNWGDQPWHNEFTVNAYDGTDKALQGHLRTADIGVITDVRFENEVKRIKAVGGINVKINNPVAIQAVIDEATRKGRKVHRSEAGLPDGMFDHVIVNDSTLDVFRDRVYKLMESIRHGG